MRTPESGGLGRCIATCLIACGAFGMAHAQAQSYTYKELNKPSGAVACEVATGFISSYTLLNAQGDVAGHCRFLGGYSFISPITFGPWYLDKPVVWRAGGAAQVLSLPSKTTVASVTVLGNGDVVGRAVPYTGAGHVDPASYFSGFQTLVWRGNTRSAWVPGWSGGTIDELAAITSSGTQGLYAQGRTQIVIGQPGAMRVLPALPASSVPTKLDYPLLVNDRGQAVVTRRATTGDKLKLDSWFWDGAAWVPITLTDGSPATLVDAMNNAGQVTGLIRGQTRYVWSTSGTFVLPGTASYYGGAWMDDTGRVLGSIPSPDVNNTNVYAGVHAAMWEAGPNGQAIDLNTRVTLPAKWVLTLALARDAQGRILVEAQDTSTTLSYNGRKVLLLTPR